ncbi:MAG: asparagine--tRNA ligase, partial [Candidatus Brockarchaeota archaeon]|nr:asparagine--tRNA ligase [Candidatus Brockarchaeota archaeon]
MKEPEGSAISTAGWLYSKNVLGKLIFLRLRDSTGIVQVAVRAENVGEKAFEALKGLQPESTVSIDGVVRKDSRAPGGVEVQAKAVRVICPSETFPIRPGVGKKFLLDNR